MSLANKLGNIYTNLNTALSDTNSALIEKGGNKVADISSIGDEIRGLETGGSDELAIGIIEGSITNLELPEVTSIKPYCFVFSSNLLNVTIPDTVISIGGLAFAYSETLESVIIGDGVISIGENAFNNCSKLKDIIIGNKTELIDKNAF